MIGYLCLAPDENAVLDKARSPCDLGDCLVTSIFPTESAI